MSERFEPEFTPLDGVVLLHRKLIGDSRGFFTRLFCADDLRPFGWTKPVAQINQSATALSGTVRGLHYQTPPYAEMKLVTCLKGRVLDVAVDLRHGSPTFLQHYSVELDAEKGQSLIVPEGFAHGFQTLTDDVQMVYATSAPYEATAERGIHCEDPGIAIRWPLTVVNLSARDAAHPCLLQNFPGVELPSSQFTPDRNA